MMNQANFVVDTEKCMGCGKCVKVCPGGILSLNYAKKAEIMYARGVQRKMKPSRIHRLDFKEE